MKEVKMENKNTVMVVSDWTKFGEAIFNRDVFIFQQDKVELNQVVGVITTYSYKSAFNAEEIKKMEPGFLKKWRCEKDEVKRKLFEILQEEYDKIIESAVARADSGNEEGFTRGMIDAKKLSVIYDTIIALKCTDIPQGFVEMTPTKYETYLLSQKWGARKGLYEKFLERFPEKTLLNTKDQEWIGKNLGSDVVIVTNTNPFQIPWDVWHQIESLMSPKPLSIEELRVEKMKKFKTEKIRPVKVYEAIEVKHKISKGFYANELDALSAGTNIFPTPKEAFLYEGRVYLKETVELIQIIRPMREDELLADFK